MYLSYLFCQKLRWAVGVHVDQKSSSMNSVSGLVNRVHWTWFVSIETEFVGLSFKAYKLSSKDSVSFSPPIAYQPTQKISYRVSKIHSEHSHSLSLSVSLSLSDSLLSLSLSLTLTLLLRLCRRRRCSVSASLSVSPSAKLLSSLLKLLDEEEALAVGVTSQSC